MKKNRFVVFASSLAFALICGPLVTLPLRSTSAQKPIPPECVESCRQVLFECIAQGERENRCIALYRSCIARCK
jgi:hypothetical protein